MSPRETSAPGKFRFIRFYNVFIGVNGDERFKKNILIPKREADWMI